MDQDTIGRIADTAVRLKNQLTALGIGDGAAYEWVASAMPAIVTYEAAMARWPAPSGGPRPPHEPRSRGELAEESFREPPREPAETPGNAVQLYIGGQDSDDRRAQLLRAQEAGRLGNVTALDGLHPDIVRQLTAGPWGDTDMRLVAVTGLAAGAAAETAAFHWVRDNVPGAGPVLNAKYAGRITAGAASPVYLVTYQLAAGQDEGSPARGTDELPS
jgi:hypothetical protein